MTQLYNIECAYLYDLNNKNDFFYKKYIFQVKISDS